MKIQIKIKSGSKVIKKDITVSATTIMSMLDVRTAQEIYTQVGSYSFDGYAISITVKD